MKAISRDIQKIPRPTTNPAVGHIMDTLGDLNIKPTQAAQAMRIPRSRFTEMVNRDKAVSADTALRLQVYLGMDAALLMRLQTEYDFQKAYHKKHKIISQEVSPVGSA